MTDKQINNSVKKKRKRYTKAERKALKLDEYPDTMYGNAVERDPRSLEEAPFDHDPRKRRYDV